MEHVVLITRTVVTSYLVHAFSLNALDLLTFVHILTMSAVDFNEAVPAGAVEGAWEVVTVLFTSAVIPVLTLVNVHTSLEILLQVMSGSAGAVVTAR